MPSFWNQSLKFLCIFNATNATCHKWAIMIQDVKKEDLKVDQRQ